jgi:arginyl-tRNA--protein-N-Asp/Glu arginylyltransferase
MSGCMKDTIGAMDEHDRRWHQDKMYRDMCDRVDKLSKVLVRVEMMSTSREVRRIINEALYGSETTGE